MKIGCTKKQAVNVLFFLSSSIVFGFLAGMIAWIFQISENYYLHFKMYNLIIFDLQKNLNRYFILFLIVFFIVLVLWLIIKRIYKWISRNYFKVEIVNRNRFVAFIFSLVFLSVGVLLFYRFFLNIKKFFETTFLFEYVRDLRQIDKYLFSFAVMIFLALLFLFLSSWSLSRFNFIKLQDLLFSAFKKSKPDKLAFVSIIFLVIINGFTMIYKKTITPRGTNIIFLTVDTLRADHLSCYGYFRDTSPNIDNLRQDSIMFSNMITVMSHTLPSYVSMFTGLYPKNHNVLMNGHTLKNKFITMTELLKNENYITGGFISAFCLEKRTNLDQGFDIYNDKFGGFFNLRGLYYIRAKEVNKKVFKWIKKNRENKFFLFVHYFDPHFPYDPLSPFDKAFDYKSDNLDQQVRYQFKNENEKDDSLKKIDLYNGEIKYVDEKIGNLINLLKELKLYEESLIIFTADHGESLGAHNWWGHELNYEDQVKIPFLIKAPFGVLKNLTIEDQVQNLDIMPFVLKVSEFRITKGNSKKIISYALEKIKIREQAFMERRLYSRESCLKYPDKCSKGAEYAVRTKEWKLIFKEKDENELYNLIYDTNELNNLIKKRKEKAEILLKLLIKWTNTHKVRPKPREIDNKVREKLRALGYIE